MSAKHIIIARNIALPLAAMALLAACGSESERSANDDRDAGGEVLEGSVSDAMIPLDQLKSQGDPAEDEPETGDADAASESAADSPPATETAGEAEPDEPAAD